MKPLVIPPFRSFWGVGLYGMLIIENILVNVLRFFPEARRPDDGRLIANGAITLITVIILYSATRDRSRS